MNLENIKCDKNVYREKKVTTKGYEHYLLFVLLFYFFVFRDFLEQHISLVGYIDELISIMAIPIFMLRLRRSGFKVIIRREGYGRWIVLFLLIGLLSSVIYQYQEFWGIALPDALLCIKFWLALYVGANVFGGIQLSQYAKKIYRHVKVITVLYMILLCLDYMFDLFDSTIRYGMRSAQLIYSHPTALVACCMFVIMVLLSIKEYVSGYMIWLVMLLALMCTSLRSKAIGAALIVALICYFVFYRKKKIRIRTMFLFVPLVFAVGWEQIEYYFFSSIQDDSARYQLLIKAFKIANDCFPLGAGFGTFGSHYSTVSYSPLYSIYGLNDVNGLRENSVTFASDSFWAMILGQTGYIGLVAFVIALVILLKKIQKIRNVSLSCYASALSGFFYLLIASMAESAFVHPLAIPMAIWLGFMLSKSKDEGGEITNR